MIPVALVCVTLIAPMPGDTALSVASEVAARAPGASPLPQEAPAPADSSWSFALRPYLWAASLSGEAGLANLPEVSFDKSFSDLLQDLELSLMLGLEARAPGERWGLLLDSIYMDLSGEKGSFDWGFQMLLLELDLALRVQEHLELLAGARYLGVDVDLDGGPGARERESKDLVDPVVGARGSWPLGERLGFAARGDVGGFGVGSELSWQLAAMLQWHATDGLDLGLGWRHLEYELDEGRLDLDVAFDGPVLGLDIHF